MSKSIQGGRVDSNSIITLNVNFEAMKEQIKQVIIDSSVEKHIDLEDLTNKLLNLHSVSGSELKKELLKAFLAGRQIERENKLTDWNEEQCKDIEHSGFNGWFNYHYR